MYQTPSAINKERNSTPLFSFLEIVMLLFMFLASMNFINRYFYCIFIAFIVFLASFWQKTKFDLDVVPLVILALCTICFSPTSTSLTSLIKPFVYMLCYLMGKNFIFNNDDTSRTEKRIETVLIVFALGAFVHLVLNLVINTSTMDIERNSYDYWTRDVISATNQAALGCMTVGIASAFFLSKKNIWIKLLATAALVTVLYYNLTTLAGRTLLIMTALSLGVGIIYIFFMRDDREKGKFKPILFVILLIVVFFVLYQTNTFGLRDIIQDSNFYQRFFGTKNPTEDIAEDSRMDAKINFLNNLNLSVLGGGNLKDKFGYAHDIFLDTYDEAGVIALVAIIIFLISTIATFVKFLKNDAFSSNTKKLILCLYAAFFMEFLIEPILQGMPWFFGVYCFIHGMLKTASKKQTLTH